MAARLGAEPGTLERVLASGEVLAEVLGTPAEEVPPGGGRGAVGRGGTFEKGRSAPLLGVSPALVFAVAVERTRADLAGMSYVREWTSPRQRLPVLGDGGLRDVLDDRARRVFLVELLASYTRVRSGSVWRQTARGRRRQRFSELDPVRLAGLLDDLPEASRGPLYRRLGDLSLFLTGVFPDHTAARAFRPIDLQRLGRAASVAPGGDELGEALELRGGVGLLEVLGGRWYRMAARMTSTRPSSHGRLSTGASSSSGGRRLAGAWPERVVATMAEGFVDARRALNLVTDRHLFPLRDRLLPAP